jgi:hypothetical protein
MAGVGGKAKRDSTRAETENPRPASGIDEAQ